MNNLYEVTYKCLMENELKQKCACVDEIRKGWEAGKYDRESAQIEVKHIQIPGRPCKPKLVPVSQVKSRKLTTETGRATLIHAITHIEFNAINLALDAVYRFRDMPDDFYTEWLKVASEEAYHFSMLHNRLQQMGYKYGDMPAHNGLWESCIRTEHDVLIRMALVPRVLEARGLDVTPSIIKKLENVGDQQTVDILRIILKDEIGHVAIGSRWFQYCCKQQQIEPESTFIKLIKEYMSGALRGPFYTEARLKAGFSEREMTLLNNL